MQSFSEYLLSFYLQVTLCCSISCYLDECLKLLKSGPIFMKIGTFRIFEITNYNSASNFKSECGKLLE